MSDYERCPQCLGPIILSLPGGHLCPGISHPHARKQYTDRDLLAVGRAFRATRDLAETGTQDPRRADEIRASRERDRQEREEQSRQAQQHARDRKAAATKSRQELVDRALALADSELGP